MEHPSPSQKPRDDRREAENVKAIGGLRDPALSIDKVPGWRAVGKRIRATLDSIIAKHADQVKEDMATIGTDTGIGISENIVLEARSALYAEFGGQNADTTGLQANLVEKLIEAALDPDDCLPHWMRGNTPLGTETEIPAKGIFPPPDDVTSEVQHYDWTAEAAFRNYAADEELKQERDKGFLEWAKDLNDLKEKYGEIWLFRIAAIVKEKNGKIKTRLVHDLRRSMVNALVHAPERVVLPRLRDAVDMALRLIANGLIEFLVLGFKDAFKQLRVGVKERKYLGGAGEIDGEPGYFVYETVLFRIVCGPLVWGRAAALVMRATAATVPRSKAESQCYVDDPITAAVGTPQVRARTLSTIVLLWHVLGLKLAWSKGKLGSIVDKLEATLKVVEINGEHIGVTVAISDEKSEKLRGTVTDMLTHRKQRRKDLRNLAGLLSWVASVTPVVRPFAQVVWAACASAPAKGESATYVATARIELALTWISEFATKGLTGTPRFFPANRPDAGVTICFDASTTGGGAGLSMPGCTSIAFYCSTTWSDRRGDPLRIRR